MILGISGTNGSGKDTTAAFFEQHGFLHLSLSEVIRDALRAERQSLTKEAQIAKAIVLRTIYGSDILARRAIKKISSGNNYIITSIRHPAEIAYLKKTFPDFFLIYIDADPLVRFQRVRERFSVDYQTFLLLDQQSKINDNPAGQQLALCAKQAEVHIFNNGTPAAFTAALQQILLRK